MVGKELEPEYWFTDRSFKQTYTNKIWWPHLLDRAGKQAAKYGADPLAYAVHAEYINRPATVIIDPEGQVRFIYRGTFWGDRPSIEQTLEMIQEEDFSFEHPQRLEIK
jgi:peroxiredoxin